MSENPFLSVYEMRRCVVIERVGRFYQIDYYVEGSREVGVSYTSGCRTGKCGLDGGIRKKEDRLESFFEKKKREGGK